MQRKLLAALTGAALCGQMQWAWAETEAVAQRRAELLRQLDAIKAELNALDAASEPAAPIAAHKIMPVARGGEPALSEVFVTGRREVYSQPAGQTATSVEREQFRNSSAFSVGELLVLTPGVTVAQGNGPRDVSVSVRGSNARQTFGIRNVQVFEDGFPVTQPDGLARTDLIDPHVYTGIDVFQGPASALYGNYATGGMINFKSRPGGEIDGVEVGTDLGRFGYRNHYVSAGNKSGNFEYSAFGSYVAGDGFTNHSAFGTDTVNLLATYTPTDNDKFTFKFVNNNIDTDVSIRLSLNQYRQNPYQQGCDNIAVAGCASVALFANGFNGARVNVSADAAGLGRHDRRTIAAARWEHAFDADTTWRTQFVFDNRDIKQPTNATSAVGTFPSFNVISDLTVEGGLAGFKATHFIGAFANFENINSNTYNVAPGGNNGPGGKAVQGGLTQAVSGDHFNYGVRAREELQFDARWSAVAGIGVERTLLDATSTAFAYPLVTGLAAAPVTTRVDGERDYTNVAPELALIFEPGAQWRLRARLAGGYGTPQATNLFVTPAGVAGNNTQLDPQRNIGLDLGAEWAPSEFFSASATAFYERFSDELVSQSPGAGLQTYTLNAPRSIHRGIEAGIDWRPLFDLLPGVYVAAAYLRNDQYYDDYTERLSAGTQSAAFDRSGNKIPGVAPQTAHLRVGYEQKSGLLNGAGGFIESDYRQAAYVDNANLVKIPGYTLYNLNLHYDAKLGAAALDELHVFFEIRNLFDTTYVASASNISDTISAATGLQNPAANIEAASGSIWAGQPRTYATGVRLKF